MLTIEWWRRNRKKIKFQFQKPVSNKNLKNKNLFKNKMKSKIEMEFHSQLKIRKSNFHHSIFSDNENIMDLQD